MLLLERLDSLELVEIMLSGALGFRAICASKDKTFVVICLNNRN